MMMSCYKLRCSRRSSSRADFRFYYITNHFFKQCKNICKQSNRFPKTHTHTHTDP